MSRHTTLTRFASRLGRARTERSARRALELELAGYSTVADRNDLELLAEAARTPQSRELVAVLRRQAEVRLFRTA